ncbi:NACHT and WD repeat domain-containing 2-like [Brachionus plicatilis]|uniref:NACHT and WD repeat domain-containing 2-like n=1 Tax=Brachionus plicatilis TaxID=10195 RepID=A0A3M7T7T5_BRAPC|nr:NACHT and WD repeat domain-containing 2-like [Brachionus plicatilis]
MEFFKYKIFHKPNYLLNGSNYPFIITGESGCGKTSVVGIVHQSIPEWFEKNTNIILITRFLGTTVQTSSIFKTYSSIALQLFYNINLISRNFNHTIYVNYSKCQDTISIRDFIYEEINIINNLDPTKKIIIILDSLDQLAPSDYKTTDKWLLTNLATNVKLICSTLPDHGNIFDMINEIISRKYKEKMIEDIREFNRTLSTSNSVTLSPMYEDTKSFLNNQILDVKSLNGEESEFILKNWLISSHKQLTESQWNDLRIMFNKANLLPLFLKLIYDIIVHYRSYENFDDQLKNCLIIDDLILYMFKRMEKIHGSTIVRRSLSYMTVCKNEINGLALFLIGRLKGIHIKFHKNCIENKYLETFLQCRSIKIKYIVTAKF